MAVDALTRWHGVQAGQGETRTVVIEGRMLVSPLSLSAMLSRFHSDAAAPSVMEPVPTVFPKIGNFMLISLAGLQSVPTELYEAARIDGAGPWSMFRRITIPLMSPILLYNLVISLITTFQYFTQAYVLTNGRGDPNNATLFINLDLFREAFVNNHMGYASAIGWLLFTIVLALTLILFFVARSRVYYAGGEA